MRLPRRCAPRNRQEKMRATVDEIAAVTSFLRNGQKKKNPRNDVERAVLLSYLQQDFFIEQYTSAGNYLKDFFF